MFRNFIKTIIAMAFVMAFSVSVYAADTTSVTINNVDEKGAQFPGVTMHIEDENGNTVIDDFVSKSSPKVVDLPAGNYKLVQTAVPEGYNIVNAAHFSVESGGKVIAGEGTMTYFGTSIAGSTKRINSDETEFPMKVEGLDGSSVVAYCLERKKLPPGEHGAYYKKISGVDDVIKSYASPESPLPADELKRRILNVMYYGYPYHNSYAAYDNLPVEYDDKWGVSEYTEITDVQLYYATQEAIWSLISGEAPRPKSIPKDEQDKPLEDMEIIKRLAFVLYDRSMQADTYNDEIDNANLDVYATKDTVNGIASDKFQNLLAAEFTTTEPGIIVYNRPITELKISKISADVIDRELVGATMKLVKGTDPNGEDVVDTWISGEVKVVDLQVGYYTLVEVAAPEGYEIASPILFYVFEDGKAAIGEIRSAGREPVLNNAKSDTIQMTDKKIKVTNEQKISKVSDVSDEELAGAELKLVSGKYPDGKYVVETWTSGEVKSFDLQVNRYYTLVETAAPEGYELAQPITFYVWSDGRLSLVEVLEDGNVNTISEKTDTVQMVDKKIINEVLGGFVPEEPKTETKVLDEYDETEVKGASEVKSAKTGDSLEPGYPALMIMSICGIIILTIIRRRERRRI